MFVGVWCMCVGDMCMHHDTCVVTTGQLCRAGSFLSPSRGLPGTSSEWQAFRPSPFSHRAVSLACRFSILGLWLHTTRCLYRLFPRGGGCISQHLPLFLPLPCQGRVSPLLLFPRLASLGHLLPSQGIKSGALSDSADN